MVDGVNGKAQVGGGTGGVTLAAPDPTWASRVGVAQFKQDGLTKLDVTALPKTADVKSVLEIAKKDPSSPASPLNDRPPLAVSAFRDEKSKQFAILLWEPADFMGTLHVFDNAGNKIGKNEILD